MKFPYGISDFYKIITEDYLYVDRTDHKNKYGDTLDLCTYAVIAVGFERLVWENTRA